MKSAEIIDRYVQWMLEDLDRPGPSYRTSADIINAQVVEMFKSLQPDAQKYVLQFVWSTRANNPAAFNMLVKRTMRISSGIFDIVLGVLLEAAETVKAQIDQQDQALVKCLEDLSLQKHGGGEAAVVKGGGDAGDLAGLMSGMRLGNPGHGCRWTEQQCKAFDAAIARLADMLEMDA